MAAKVKHDQVMLMAARNIKNLASQPVQELSLRQLWLLYKTTSYLYYKHDYSLLSDRKFDHICSVLLRNYNPEIVHTDQDSLKAGTGYHLKHGVASQSIGNFILTGVA